MDIFEHGKWRVFRPEGRLDTTTSPVFRELVDPSVAEGVPLVIDFSRITYLSSIGVSVLIHFQKRAKAAGSQLVLTSLPDPVASVFQIADLTSIFEIAPSTDSLPLE